jgi:mannose-6-phosphate isomerase-like protein (cupin superfamily)
MKAMQNRVGGAQQNTKRRGGVLLHRERRQPDGVLDVSGRQGVRRALHDFDEYMICVSGQYRAVVNGTETVLGPGEELLVPKGAVQSGSCTAGTRTIHAFGGCRIK